MVDKYGIAQDRQYFKEFKDRLPALLNQPRPVGDDNGLAHFRKSDGSLDIPMVATYQGRRWHLKENDLAKLKGAYIGGSIDGDWYGYADKENITHLFSVKKRQYMASFSNKDLPNGPWLPMDVIYDRAPAYIILDFWPLIDETDMYPYRHLVAKIDLKQGEVKILAEPGRETGGGQIDAFAASSRDEAFFGLESGQGYVFDLNRGLTRLIYNQPEVRVRAAAFSGDGSCLAVATQGGEELLYKATGARVSLGRELGEVVSLAVSQEGTKV